jgi:peptidyl-prolyl cis-trans isomerase SurA
MVLFLLLACGSSELPPAPPPPAPPQVEAVRPEDFPAPRAPSDARYAASHILIAYADAVRAPETTTRSASQAEELARELLARARAGEDFARLAAEHSNGPSAPRGGWLGTYLTGTMVPAFEAAVAGAEIGGFTLAETPYGWHVIRRDPVEHVRVQHLVVGFEGAHESTATRSVAEARELLVAAQEALAGGESFDAIASRLNEDASRSTGGHLGGFGRGQMVPAFEDTAFGLTPGETSAIVRTPYGLHIVRRLE